MITNYTKTIYIVIFIALICIILIFLSLKQSTLDFTFYKDQKVETLDITKPYWFLVKTPKSDQLATINVDLKEVDFTKNNVIISVGSEINRIVFNKKSLPFINSHFVTVHFSGNFDKNIVYIYLIKKVEVYEDLHYMNTSVIEK